MHYGLRARSWSPGNLKVPIKMTSNGNQPGDSGGIVPRDVIFIGTLKLPGDQDLTLKQHIYRVTVVECVAPLDFVFLCSPADYTSPPSQMGQTLYQYEFKIGYFF